MAIEIRAQHLTFRVTTLLAFNNARTMRARATDQPRKQPIQQRSNALVAALTKAAARILSQRSLDELTTNQIAGAIPDLNQHQAVRDLARAGRQRLSGFLRERQHETRALDPELSALILGRAMEAAIHDVIIEQPLLLEDPHLVSELATLYVSYLGCRGRES
jgi:Tetracyclin repressor-like, C-terminal domain